MGVGNMASRDNPDFLSAESLMDDKVINIDGEDLGKFDDLMIDLAEGKIAYAALSFGGTLGMGDKLFAIPWKALTLRVHEHAFVLDIPKEVLKNAEGFDKDNWPATSRESLSTMYRYYGYQPYWDTETTRRIDLPGETESERLTRTTRTEDVDNSGFLRASKIQGEKVVNRDNDTLGKIEDIMIDLQDGRIAYAVISHGGVIGIGSKHIPIPWQAFSLRTRDRAFVVDIPKDVLDKAEGLDKDKWPVTREELSRTYSYYGYQPYWQMGAAARLAEVPAAVARVEPETTTQMESERAVRTETAVGEPLRTEEGIQARSERERLEILKAEEEKRLSQIERELEEARRQEEAERATKLEEELKQVRLQEETQRERLAQLERERIEVERKTETEKERLARLGKEGQI
jgi:sporulation protein YlmC with PRC-barrel domain